MYFNPVDAVYLHCTSNFGMTYHCNEVAWIKGSIKGTMTQISLIQNMNVGIQNI